MQFYEILEELIQQSGCTAKEIAKSAGISESTLSRYRKGERLPDFSMAERIFCGISHAAIRNGSPLPEHTHDILMHTLNYTEFSPEYFEYLLTEFSVSLTKLASYVNYTPSYLSRIRSGKCAPSDSERFLNGLCQFLQNETDARKLAAVLGSTENSALRNTLRNFLWIKTTDRKEKTDQFLENLDKLDLNQYMSAFQFDKSEIMTREKIQRFSKEYIDTEQMHQAEMEFFRLTLLSEADEPIFMHNQMSVLRAEESQNFKQQRLEAAAFCLKRGLHLNIVYEMDKPAEEMVSSLRAWLPLYMTGLISPYYLKKSEKGLYQNALYVSGSVSMTGACVQHKSGYYCLSTESEKIAVSKEQAAQVLKAASPLMKIFTTTEKRNFYESTWPEALHHGKRIALHSEPPLHTISQELLASILKRNHVSQEKQKLFLDIAHSVKAHAEMVLQTSEIIDIVPDLTEEDFQKHPLSLPLTECFCDSRYQYTYEEYQEHLAQTKEYQKKYKNYTLILKNKALYQNIRIISQLHDSVMISKSNPPVVHFVIHHPKIVRAIEESCLKEYAE